MESKQYPEEVLTLKTYDGCGSILYKVIFYNLELLEHLSEFNYASSDVSSQVITVGFENSIFIENHDNPGKPISFPKKTMVNKQTEEVEINFLNSKFYIPGKTVKTVKTN